MANDGRPERQRRAETDTSVFALENSIDEIWRQAHQAIRAMELLPDLKTHRLDVRLGKKRVALFPERHNLPLSDGAVAEVKWDKGGGYWNLVEIKKAWGDERFILRTRGNDGFSITIEPIAKDQFWIGNIVWRFRMGIVKVDEERMPFRMPVDPELLGGVFELNSDGKSLEFCSVYAGDEILDPIHYQLTFDRSDPLCRHLCEPMVRLLSQVFG